MRCPTKLMNVDFKGKANINSERYGFTHRQPNRIRTTNIFQPGSSFSTVMNVKIEKRLTVVRSRSEASVLSNGDSVDTLAEAEREQILQAMFEISQKCISGNVIFSEHRGHLRSLKRFHTHIIFESDADFKMFIPPYNHRFLVYNRIVERIKELKNWALKDYKECEERIFRLAISDHESVLNPEDNVTYDVEKGCSKLHLPYQSGDNPFDLVYQYIHKYGLKNYHYGIVYSPGGSIIDVFIHIFPPDFIDHLVLQRGESLVFAQEYLQHFHKGILTNNLQTFVTT
jgi:hypothetical protein